MTQAAQSATLSDLEYSRGKQLAIQVFLDAMAALDVRSAMLAKLKREGELLKAGEIFLLLLRPPRVVAFGKAASRMAAVVASLPELQKRMVSIHGMATRTASASFSSPSWGAPKLVPRFAWAVMASTTAGGAWPRIRGPQLPT